MRRINSDNSDYSVRKILRTICRSVFSTETISKTILFAMIFCSSAVWAQVQTEWVQTYSVSGTSCFVDKGEVDKEGNFILGGRTGTTIDILVLKYSPSGNLLWSRIYDRAGSVDWIKDLKLDDSGNVYITAWTNEGTPLGGQNWLTLKYSAEGELRWAKSLDWTLHDEDIPFSLSLDRDNNVYVTGYGWSPPAGYQNSDYVLAKYNSDGVLLWTRSYDSGEQDADWAYSVVTDELSNAYVSGYAYGSLIATVKYNRDGDSLWVRKFFRNSSEYATFPLYSTIDKESNIIVNGHYENGSNFNFVTLKYDKNGQLYWGRIFDSPIGRDDAASDLYVDDNLNVFVTGRTANFENDILVIKYFPNGDSAWTRTYDNALGQDYATCMTGDENGNVYISGYGHSSSLYDDYLTLKYNSVGNLVWFKDYNSSINPPGSDHSFVISMDKSNNVLISGNTHVGSNPYVMTSIKYSQLTIIHENEGKNFHIYDLENFPNPFNSRTIIKYKIDQTGYVNLEIFNSLGEVFLYPFKEMQMIGEYKVTFDAQNLPSGVYFCTLSINGIKKKTIKMISLK